MRPGQLVARAGGGGGGRAECAPCAENGEPHRGGVGCLHGVETCTGSKQGGCPSCAPGATLPYYPPHPCLVGAMRQRKLGSHTPPCHRRMVITTLFSVLLAALQRRLVLYHTRWLLVVHWLWSSGH